MADMPTLRDITNGTAADAADVEFNFNTIETHIDASLVRTDGTNPMAADLAMGSNQVTGLAVPGAVAEAARFGDAATSDYQVTGGGTTITTSATTICTFTVYSAAASMALFVYYGDFTTAGVSSYDGLIGTGEGALELFFSFTGTTVLSPSSLQVAGFSDNQTQAAGTNRASSWLITLAAGTNTIVLQGTRVNNGTTATDGTLTVNTGFRAMIVGA